MIKRAYCYKMKTKLFELYLIIIVCFDRTFLVRKAALEKDYGQVSSVCLISNNNNTSIFFIIYYPFNSFLIQI